MVGRLSSVSSRVSSLALPSIGLFRPDSRDLCSGPQCAVRRSHRALCRPQAQERGELLQLQDDAMYALDGLRRAGGTAVGGGAGGGQAAQAQPPPTATQRESAVALAEIMATRRGRAALR